MPPRGPHPPPCSRPFGVPSACHQAAPHGPASSFRLRACTSCPASHRSREPCHLPRASYPDPPCPARTSPLRPLCPAPPTCRHARPSPHPYHSRVPLPRPYSRSPPPRHASLLHDYAAVHPLVSRPHLATAPSTSTIPFPARVSLHPLTLRVHTSAASPARPRRRFRTPVAPPSPPRYVRARTRPRPDVPAPRCPRCFPPAAAPTPRCPRSSSRPLRQIPPLCRRLLTHPSASLAPRA
ncbi:hypothetical protein B0H14DRAFT_1597636 [Mycena olivaceomarginata]|nr:hypothetical protein B0H14DRAFT_1597636 [Mycena olivaceomarginata]